VAVFVSVLVDHSGDFPLSLVAILTAAVFLCFLASTHFRSEKDLLRKKSNKLNKRGAMTGIRPPSETMLVGKYAQDTRSCHLSKSNIFNDS